MKLSQKLILYALAIALLPLAATGFTLISLSERALRDRVEKQHTAAATALSGRVDQAIDDLHERAATVLELVDFAELSVDEREGVAILLYRQASSIAAVVLLDAGNASLAPPVYLAEGTAVPEDLRGHPLATEHDVARLIRRAIATPSRAPYFPGDGTARIALTFPVMMAGERIVAAMEVVLLPTLLHAPGVDIGEGSEVFLVDARGKALVHPTLPAGTSLDHLPPVSRFMRERTADARRYGLGDASHLAAFAPLRDADAAVVVSQPESLAFAVVSAMRRRILLWIAVTLLVVLVTGILFADGLRRRLDALIGGARRFGERELGHAITLDTRDELAELASTMNSMAAELSRTLSELEEWNQTLEARVAQRTAELEQTQAQLITQSKMAAIGQLGAGVAHEINNPLAGVLGFAQLLLRGVPDDDPKRAGLEQIESAAQRCREITTKLLRYSERSEETSSTRFSMASVIRETVELTESAMRTGGIDITLDLTESPDEVEGVPGEMSVALINLMTNARTAMPEGGTLSVCTEIHDERVRVEVRDTGKGIPSEDLPRIFDPFFTRKEEWRGVGLGLSLVYRIINDMGGAIQVADTGPEGTTIRMELPRRSSESRASA